MTSAFSYCQQFFFWCKIYNIMVQGINAAAKEGATAREPLQQNPAAMPWNTTRLRKEWGKKMNAKDNSLIKQNEKEANIFVAKVMRISALLFTGVLILNIMGIFIINMVPMVVAYIIGVVLLAIPTIITNVLKKDGPAVKYIYVTIAVLFVSILIVTLNWHVVVMYIFAIGIASMYFSKGVNRYAVIFSLACFSIAQYLAYLMDYTNDRNE